MRWFFKNDLVQIYARVAQLEEQRPSKAKVTGSIPVSRTIKSHLLEKTSGD